MLGLCCGWMGIMGKKMETTILGYIEFKGLGLKSLGSRLKGSKVFSIVFEPTFGFGLRFRVQGLGFIPVKCPSCLNRYNVCLPPGFGRFPSQSPSTLRPEP